ncbi:hypothetical protein FRB98_006383 [Tulasnella sp. 332]|nr:hypothetical protein FRB98_006383 [Tulasnella sp. 332]
MTKLCGGQFLVDISSGFSRDFWSSVVPFSLVVVFVCAAVPLPRRFRWLAATIKAPFKTFLPVSEAESMIPDDKYAASVTDGAGRSSNSTPDPKATTKAQPPIWRTAILAILSATEALTWFAIGSYRAYELFEDRKSQTMVVVAPFLTSITWLYAAIRPVIHPTATPPYDMFFLFLTHFISAALDIGVPIYMHHHAAWTLPTISAMVVLLANLATIMILLSVILAMPLSIPSERARRLMKEGKCLAEEDYTSLFGWITFSWAEPLVKRGITKELEAEDVPEMSPSMQSKPVYERFMQLKSSTLLRRIFAANSLDFIIDVVFTLVSSICNYATPFFLKRILDDITFNPDPKLRSAGYIYALLSFAALLAKAESDVQHLWAGRRASTRIKTELMAAVYMKALRRKDFSGITKKDDETEKEKMSGKPTGKSGADIGKIVQLMSADSNRVAQLASSAYMLYAAPIDIVIASTMLYQLLGWSAFAGFAVLIVASPLSHLLSKRSVTIRRGQSAAQDKRMAILNELIGGIRFIKFFAWEEQWIKRVQEARAVELSWLLKDRVNSVLFGLVWSLSPTCVAVIAFATYVLVTGQQLTISTAFTSIALFNMLRMPLNVIPMFIVQLLQASVALERIEAFLGEEEVPDYVSSFRRPVPSTQLTDEDHLIGITGASFVWNQPKKEKKADSEKKPTLAARFKSILSRRASAKKPELPTVSEVTATQEASAPEGDGDKWFQLTDINVIFPVGQLSLVVGPTASGKSALLMALLGEMTLVNGPTDARESPIHLPKNPSQLDPATQLRNHISYCAQSPWLEHATIKDNILFGSPYEESRYQAVVSACALEPDLKVLDDGDETEIGSRGVSLSGGQKARVALARALYSRTKHVLLDDPLAAVDSHTARHLYENVLLGPLMAHRTCILVTHHVDLVQPGAHYLVRMLDGRIDTQGTIKDLEAQGLLEAIIRDSSLEQMEAGASGSKTPSDDAETVAEVVVEGKTVEEIKESPATIEAPVVATTSTPPAFASAGKKSRRLIKDEARAKGNVKWNIYKTYLKASNYRTWVWMILGIGWWQCYGIMERLWIKTWGEHYYDTANAGYLWNQGYVSYTSQQDAYDYRPDPFVMGVWPGAFSPSSNPPAMISNITTTGITDRLPSATEHPLFYVSIYAAIGMAAALTTLINSFVMYTGAYRASKILFTRLLTVIIRSPIRFFDTTPAGRILNRFSSDISTVDNSLSGSLRSTANYVGNFIASVITVIVVVPPFALPAVFAAFVYWKLSYGYVITGRMLRRMESTTRSPIFAAFGDALEGLVTVRAFSSERRFVDRTHTKVDLTIKIWLLLRFDSLGAFSTLMATIFALSRLDPGLAGLAITSAMAFTTAVYWTCRTVTTLEVDLNSVERVVEYLDLPQEPPATIESSPVPAYWPSSSSSEMVVVENLVIKYAPDLPAVLHEMSFTLNPKERVGLLGRTGSGKSTLAMALLRFVDPTEGRIMIDGLDISKIGLYDLRSRVAGLLTIIPQDAVLFSGNIRDNLDPFNDHTDEECLDALGRVHLNTNETSNASRSHRASATPAIHEGSGDEALISAATSQTGTTQVEDLKHGGAITLKTKVSAGGANFSQGQRQLIAMARALLRQSSIIIMDEATSSIDFAADAAVQKTIREEFTNALLVTIAHRIRTIIDYDRLIVMDQGRIVEIDTPYNLINKEGGIFRGMCLKSGQFDELLLASKGEAVLHGSST